jgi:hypothetical protein
VAFADIFPGTKPNLHAFWDEAYRVEARDGKIVESYRMPELGHRPAPGEGVIADEARKIMARFPIETMQEEAAELNPEAWAKESYTLGCTKAYPPGDHPGDSEVRALAPDFAAPSQEIAAKQIALAGYRLAKVLENLYAEKK